MCGAVLGQLLWYICPARAWVSVEWPGPLDMRVSTHGIPLQRGGPVLATGLTGAGLYLLEDATVGFGMLPVVCLG